MQGKSPSEDFWRASGLGSPLPCPFQSRRPLAWSVSQQSQNAWQHHAGRRPLPWVWKEVHLALGAPTLGVEWDQVGPLRLASVGHGSAVIELAGSVGWAELGGMRLKVLLEEFEAELLTVALEHLGQGWGATEEHLPLALLLSGHFLEHLEPTRGRREQRQGSEPVA